MVSVHCLLSTMQCMEYVVVYMCGLQQCEIANIAAGVARPKVCTVISELAVLHECSYVFRF